MELMCTPSPAVVDLFRCIGTIKKRRGDGGAGAPAPDENQRGKRRSQMADKALRERYLTVLQRRDGYTSLTERIKTLRRMVLSQGLPGDVDDKQASSSSSSSSKVGGSGSTAGELKGKDTSRLSGDTSPAASSGAVDMDGRCPLRGLVWKVLLGTIHTDAVLYVRLVGRGPSSEDMKIREDTFRTFHGDEEFKRRVPEDKLSRVNNAFVRLNSPGEEMMGPGGIKGVERVSSSEKARDEKDEKGCDDLDFSGSGSGSGSGYSRNSNSSDKPGGVRANGRGLYVQGMTVLCAPLLFVMPEVDAFYCFNALLNHHMPRYVSSNLDGVHAGCALVDRTLSTVDPVLSSYLESKFLSASIYAFPLVMSLHACIPPLEEVVKLWDAVFSFGVHLEVLICVAQCVSLRDTLLQDPNPYQHLNARNLPPLDAELLVSGAFALIPHLPPDLMDEIALHPFAGEVAAEAEATAQVSQLLPGRSYRVLDKLGNIKSQEMIEKMRKGKKAHRHIIDMDPGLLNKQ